MPLSGSDVATKPAGTTAVPNTTIESAPFNDVVDDIYQILNTPRSIAKGATGATNVEDARTNLELDKKVVYATKSGDYTAVSADNNAIHRFTANATLSLTAAATLGSGWHYFVVANGGSVTVDPNGTELIDGASTITIPNGCSTLIFCSGSAFYTDMRWIDAQPEVSVASATTTDIGAAASRNITITGTTTITGLGTVANGVTRVITFSGALTLTHNATSLILPGGANITTAAGDTAVAYSLGSGNWRVLFYQRASASPLQVTGTAPTFACRAWVNFDGTSGPSVRGSGNVSTVVRNATGDYTITFTNAMPDANYAVVASANASSIDTTVSIGASQTSSAFRVYTVSNGVVADNANIHVAVFR